MLQRFKDSKDNWTTSLVGGGENKQKESINGY